MADITLSSAVRSNLNTLQQTASFMSDVQNKLATGKKVNSALDNPNSFFTASGLTSRANDLSTLLDDMGQSVQTLKAADEGISSISKLVESAKAKANQALQTQSQYERKQFATQYNELLTQIEDLAKDAGYKGKNLLAGSGNDLTTIFNEDSTSKLTIDAVDYTDTSLSTGLNLSDLAEGEGSATSFQLEGGTASFTLTDGSGQALNSSSLLSSASGISTTNTLTLNDGSSITATISGSTLAVTAGTTVQDLLDTIEGISGVRAEFDESSGEVTIFSNDDIALQNSVSTTAQLVSVNATQFATTSDTLVGSGSFEAGDTLTLTDGNNFELGSLEIEADTTVDDLVNFINDFQGVSAEFNTSTGKVSIESETDLSLTSDNADFNADTFTADTDGVTISALSDSGFATDGDIERTVDRLNTALSTLRTQASEFGTNLSIVENRQDFTKSLINTLEEGAGLLTLADTNEEGANLLALQTRQSLASTSLSFAAQADQNVLRLF
ncbi:flagellin [Labrenzia sp. VG12]|uniref:flagellin N-terminal helical domain-containing protein n=1 Tax=Labrenzia sp. VG12 TaxID=2021862 RepID=UPI000B8C46C4|nr:flagellin [Labrenzia sp. VG12]ASP33548.1 ABC transporter substrate-binding protein [Labrenzia sp. VG12]